MRNFLIITIVGFIFITCSSDANHKEVEPKIEKVNIPSNDLAKGFKLFANGCASCHNPDLGVEVRIAPSLKEIKNAYMLNNHTLKDFQEAMVQFMNKPSIEMSLMPKAVEKYGVMPKMDYSKEQIILIASYLYQTDLSKEDWYNQVYLKDKVTFESYQEEKSPLEIGKDLAMKTKSVLGKNLMNAIKNNGADGAVTFCNTKAYPLTDSMSILLNASIKRVSDRNRNPENNASEQELAYINSTIEKIKEGKEAKPQLNENDGKIIAYYPIMTNDMCMKCHGDPGKDIDDKTMSKINKLYPNDKAIGYKPEQLRGIWVVEMKK